MNTKSSLTSDTCWVYVRQDYEDNYTIGIEFDEAFPGRELECGREIILWRRFDDLLAASGYRIVLSNFSPDELREVIRNYNVKKKIKK